MELVELQLKTLDELDVTKQLKDISEFSHSQEISFNCKVTFSRLQHDAPGHCHIYGLFPRVYVTRRLDHTWNDINAKG